MQICGSELKREIIEHWASFNKDVQGPDLLKQQDSGKLS